MNPTLHIEPSRHTSRHKRHWFLNRPRLTVIVGLTAVGLMLQSTDASAQTLPWTIVTTSVRMTPNQSSTHTEHARPTALRPFLRSSFPVGEARSRTTIDWSIEVVNAGPSAATFKPEMLRSWEYVTDGFCWGVDPPGQFLRYPVDDDITVAAATTAPFQGTQELHFSIAFDFNSCPAPLGDSLHTASGQSTVFAGPEAQSGWTTLIPAPISITDTGTTFTNEVEITTNYDLPLIAGSSGCDPLFANSTGATGALEAFGVADVSEGLVVLSTRMLPPNEFVLPVLATTTSGPTPLGVGQGTLCLGAPQYRWLAAIGLTDVSGQYAVAVTPDFMPVPGGAIVSGSTWAFQIWHRDGPSNSNTTNSVVVTFQ